MPASSFSTDSLFQTATRLVPKSAPFLSEEQKRDIFYNNAARFLRLTEQEIAKHQGR